MWSLERALAEIAGLPHVSLQPSAGSHGELAGVLLTRAYHADRGEQRRKVLTPDTAHGTNPATVTMAGYEVVKVGTDARGGVDLDDLRAKADDGRRLPDADQPQHARPVRPEHRGDRARSSTGSAATLYYDGANLNAVMGISRPGDMGFDIVHFNLHKSFTQPHGGGGPGSGPIAVSERVAPYLPRPVSSRRGARGQRLELEFDLDHDRPQVDRPPARLPRQLRLLRARLRLHLLARRAPACKDASETAVLNANYLLARLRELRRHRVPAARLRASCACTSSCSRGGADEARAAASRRSTSPSACSTSASTRRPSTSRCSSRRR